MLTLTSVVVCFVILKSFLTCSEWLLQWSDCLGVEHSYVSTQSTKSQTGAVLQWQLIGSYFWFSTVGRYYYCFSWSSTWRLQLEIRSRRTEKEGSCSIDFRAKLHFYSEKEILRKLVLNTHFRGAREKIIGHLSSIHHHHHQLILDNALPWIWGARAYLALLSKVHQIEH